jgi:hypothetical protein
VYILIPAQFLEHHGWGAPNDTALRFEMCSIEIPVT